MEERKFINLKKEEYGIKEYIKRSLGKGKISRLDIEYTPIGEKIIISTSRPGLVIGRKGEKIGELTRVLKTRFKLENPHIEISEIEHPLFDAQLVADDIAMALERMGNLKFKVIAYRKLQEIMSAGALGCEIRLTGKLPSERARSWRFAEGYLKKSGESKKEIDRAKTTALTKTGIIGVKVAIMDPTARIYDKIDIDDELKAKIKGSSLIVEEGKTDKVENEKKVPEDKEEKVEEIEKQEKKEEKKIVKEAVEKVKKRKETKKQEEKEIAEEIEKVEEEKEEKIKELKKEAKKEDKEKQEEKKEEPSFSEDKMETKNLNVKPEEDGTAIKIEEEIEEGIPEQKDNKDENIDNSEVKEK